MAPAVIRSFFRISPIWVQLYITRRCNLDCRYCCVKDNSKKELNTEEFKRIIDRLHYLGCRFVSFFGGEPTLRKDLCELISYASKKNMITMLSTNGTLIDRKMMEDLGKSRIDMINISVDSIMKYDFSKKDISKQETILDLLLEGRKRFGYELMCALVLTPKNLKAVPDTVKHIHSKGLSIAVTLPVRDNYSPKKQDEACLFRTEKEKKELFKTVEKIIEMKKQRYRLVDPIEYYENIPRFIEDPDMDWYCASGEYMFSVDCDGKFLLCTGAVPEKMSIFDIDRDYHIKIKKKRDAMFRTCKKRCFGSCAYSTSYFIKHPLSFLKGMI